VLTLSYLDVYGTTCNAILFVVATERAISYTLGRLYGPVLSLSFLDICVTTCDAILFVVATERAISYTLGSAQSIFLRYLWYNM
jgi:hypothetical protein